MTFEVPATTTEERSAGSGPEDGQTSEPVPVAKPRTIWSIGSGPSMAVWHIWRGSPQLLAHAIRVAERATSATATSIEVAVDRDIEAFSSPKAFVRDVTFDALRHFSWIAASASGPDLKVQVFLGWKSQLETILPWRPEWGDADAAVIVVAEGVDPADERSAVVAVHAAMRRGGTDQAKLRRVRLLLCQVLIGLLLFVIFIAISVLAVGVRADTPFGAVQIDNVFAFASNDFAQVVLAGLVGALAVGGGAWFGRRAYPALEVAERGQTRIVRATRWLGGTALSFIVAAFAKAINQS